METDKIEVELKEVINRNELYSVMFERKLKHLDIIGQGADGNGQRLRVAVCTHSKNPVNISVTLSLGFKTIAFWEYKYLAPALAFGAKLVDYLARFESLGAWPECDFIAIGNSDDEGEDDE